MSSIRTLHTRDDLSRQDAEDLSKDVRRILRRARYWIRQDHAIKRARPLIQRSAENLTELLRELKGDDDDEESFEATWALLDDHRDRALEAVDPFVGFFRSHGLLPADEITVDSLLVHVLVEAANQGRLSWE